MLPVSGRTCALYLAVDFNTADATLKLSINPEIESYFINFETAVIEQKLA